VTWNGHRANRTEITALFRVALVIFVVTVVIGIANGTKVFGTLDRNVLLTHLTPGPSAGSRWVPRH